MAKKTPPTKKNILANLPKVKAGTNKDLEKEALRSKTRIEDASLEQDYADFSALLASRGWLRLKFINEENARLLGEQILKKKDNDGEPLDEVACDRLRDQRDAILEFINFPEKVIARYQEAHEPPPEDLSDPYETAEQASRNRPEESEDH